MAQAAGSNAQIIFDVETVFGTTPTPDAKLFYFLSDSFGEKRALHRSDIIRGNRNLTKPVRGNKDVSGNIKTELSPYMATFLKHLLGTNTTTGANPYTHTMKAGALPVSLCLEKGFTDLAQYFLYNGCRINRGTFEFASDGIIPASFDFMGQKRTISGTSFDATPVNLGHLPFDGFEATIEEGGSSIAYVSKCTVDIFNDLDGGNYVIAGAGQRRAIPEGKTAVTGTLTALFESITLFNKAVNFTESSIKITMTRGDGLGSAGNESLVIFIPEVVYEVSDPLVSGPKGIVVEMPYSAFYDNAAEATSIQIVLKNTQSAI